MWVSDPKILCSQMLVFIVNLDQENFVSIDVGFHLKSGFTNILCRPSFPLLEHVVSRILKAAITQSHDCAKYLSICANLGLIKC